MVKSLYDDSTYFVEAGFFEIGGYVNASKRFDTLKEARAYADEIWNDGAKIEGIYKELYGNSTRIE